MSNITDFNTINDYDNFTDIKTTYDYNNNTDDCANNENIIDINIPFINKHEYTIVTSKSLWSVIFMFVQFINIRIK